MTQTRDEAGRAEYERRMHRVLEHIDRHLDRTLELAELADVAHFSAFHFHRLFSAWMGETLGEYLRRRRLEVAAQRLLAQPRLPVLDIALAVGFGSGEAFARAFKSRFGCTASQWRGRPRSRKHDQSLRKRDQAPRIAHGDDEASQPSEVFMHPIEVKLIERAAVKVAYLRRIGPYGEAIGTFWLERVAPWMRSNNLFGRPRYGISHDDPDITAAAQCRYDACVEVPEGFVATCPALMTTLPGGRYAATRFFGTSAEIGATWAALLRDWLPASNLQLDARPCFEHYPSDARYDERSGAFECDIAIPVTPL